MFHFESFRSFFYIPLLICLKLYYKSWKTKENNMVKYISLTKEITTELQYCNSHHNSVYLMVLYVMSEKYTVMQRNVIY